MCVCVCACVPAWCGSQISGTDLAFVAENYVDMMDNASLKITRASAVTIATMANHPHAADATSCVEANMSVCPATTPLAHGDSVTLFLFNPLGWTRTEMVSVPVPVANVEVVVAAPTALNTTASSPRTSAPTSSSSTTTTITEVESEVHHATSSDPDRGHNYTLWIRVADLGPLETRVLTIQPASQRTVIKETKLNTRSTVALSAPGGATAVVDGVTGQLLQVNGTQAHATLQYYVPSVGDATSKGWTCANPCSSA